jgi:hypothetical protein
MAKIKQVKKRKIGKDGYTKANPKTLKNKFQYAITPKSSLIVAHMQLNTGDFEDFVVRAKGGMFVLFKKKYLVDDDFLVWNRTYKMYQSNYHEDMTIPVKQHIPVNEIKNKMKNDVNASYSRVVNNVEPAILTSWNSNKVIQDSLKGQKLGDTMAKQTIMLWVIGVIGLVTMLITLNMSGLLGGASSAI